MLINTAEKELWYSAVTHSEPERDSQRTSKKILGWSRFTIYSKYDLKDNSTNMIAIRCPEDIKAKIFIGQDQHPLDLSGDPMRAHLFFLRNVWFNYYLMLEEIRKPMFEEVRASKATYSLFNFQRLTS